MKIRAGLFILCLGLFTCVHASWQGNWLFGVSGGFAERKGHLNFAMQYTGLPLFPLTAFMAEHTDRNFVPGILGGYQIRRLGWIVGGELSIDLHKNSQYAFAYSDLLHFLGWNVICAKQTEP